MRSLPLKSVEPQAPEAIRQGGVLAFKTHEGGAASGRGGGLRGRIQGLSDAARRRLMLTFASVDWSSAIRLFPFLYFLTLTTTPECWADYQRIHEGFNHRLRMRWERYWGRLPIFWRMEHGDLNGMLHIHAITFMKRDCHLELRLWLLDNWRLAMGANQNFHVKVEPVDSLPNLLKYLAKYACKAAGIRARGGAPSQGGAPGDAPDLIKAHIFTEEERPHTQGEDQPLNTGRWWGVWFKDELPFAEEEKLDLGDVPAVMYAFRRLFRKRERARWRIRLRNVFVLGKASGEIDVPLEKMAAWVEKRVNQRIRWLSRGRGFAVIEHDRSVIDGLLRAAEEVVAWRADSEGLCYV